MSKKQHLVQHSLQACQGMQAALHDTPRQIVCDKSHIRPALECHAWLRRG